LECSGTVIHCDDGKRRLFIPRLTLKHIGKTKIVLQQKGSAYTLLFSDASGNDASQVEWETDGKWYGVFFDHYWIEPDELIFDEGEVFVIPQWASLVKLEGRIVGLVRPLFREKPIEWNSSVVIDCTRR
jgi:hypothetical protein